MALKKIRYDVRLLSTEKTLHGKVPVVYTNDLNSAEFVFNILDMTPEQLAGATVTTLLYMRDGSFFQNSDVGFDGTAFTYLLKENEGNHGGLAKIQLVVKIGTAEYASQLYNFEVVSGLETKVAVAVEVMIQDWTTLTRDARAYIDQFVADEAVRQQQFETAEALRQQKETERQGAEALRQAGYDADHATAVADHAMVQGFDTRLTAEETATANNKISAVKGKTFADVNARFEELETQSIALDARKANKSQEAWITPTLLSGVENYVSGAFPVRYYRNEFNTVYLDGVSTGRVAAGTLIFALPVGYRPSRKVHVPTVAGSVFGWLTIDTDGSVRVGSNASSNVYISYGGISFRAEK